MKEGKSIVLLSIGSNLGNRERTIFLCVEALGEIPNTKLLRSASLLDTVAIGPEQPNFINSAVVLETTLLPAKLLAETTRIEDDFGRERSVRWGARTLDIDIILFGDTVILTESLEIPHPRFREREFVLTPACEIAPDFIDPVSGKTVRQLLSQIKTKNTSD